VAENPIELFAQLGALSLILAQLTFQMMPLAFFLLQFFLD
jgi:hypothetical protein